MSKYITHTVEETISVGKSFGESISVGNIVFLQGEMGAGKTHFVKGVARALGINETIKSPTYTLIREYQTKNCNLYHGDFYRLEGGSIHDVESVEDMLKDTKGIFLFEWPNNLDVGFISPSVIVKLEYINQSTREITIDFLENS